MDFDEFQEILNIVLDSKDILAKNKDDNTLIMNGFCITKESILAIEDNYLFFKDIPPKNLKEELIKLCYSINHYESENRISWKALHYFFNIDKKVRPAVSIASDIKKLKKYSSLIEDIFSHDKKNCKNFLYTNEILIKDLEEKKFNIISKYRYYNMPSSKADIRETLKDIREKYKLKNVSVLEKAIIDELPSYNYSEEELSYYSSIAFKCVEFNTKEEMYAHIEKNHPEAFED